MSALVVNSRREPYDVFIGRPSKWGNPFRIGKDGSRGEVVVKYRDWFFAEEQRGLRDAARRELCGKVLGCFCAPSMCHGDFLAAVANGAVDE
jgi:hypothetical protein